ncbi:MAG: asparagine synthase (glutamine-hydrolyzing) [Phycisphaerae bacterium]
MCGIAGLICNDALPGMAALTTRMTQRLRHRGPDDGGVVAFGRGGSPATLKWLGAADEPVEWGANRAAVTLGARRLAIVDRSPAGRQPMAAPDRQAWLVFNGEIYNHDALRGELAARGMAFAGHSDTEVALAAYRAWGGECVRRFRGMWALAIVDWVAGRLVLSRDPLGIKPLYLAAFEHGYAFASEIKSLLLLPGVTRDIHAARLRDFLVDGRLDHTPDTLFESVWSLAPGCRLEIDLRPPSLTATLGRLARDWPVAGQNAPGALAGAAAEAELRDRLDDAVRVHLRGDAAVGSCLSGGLDSSAIVATIRAAPAERRSPNWSQHCFSAVLPGDALDEGAYVDAVHAAHPGLIDHRVVPEPARLLDQLDRLLWFQDEPFASPSIFMQWEVMRAAQAAGIRVLLDGQGGDELFCGYPGCRPAYVADRVGRLRLIAALREWRAAPAPGELSRGALLMRAAGQLLPRPVGAALRDWRDRRAAPHLAGELWTAQPEARPPYRQRVPQTPPQARPPIARCGRFEAFCWRLLVADSLPALLHYEDRNSMAHGIEARVPWLDGPLVEFALRLPSDEKLRGGELKRIVRRALADRLPPAVSQRRDKIGFAAPTAAWLAGPLSGWWRDLFASKSFQQRGCFEPRGAAELARRFDAGAPGAATQVWRAAIVEAWARRMLDRAVDAE